jgi:hypothetical protein
VGGGGLHGVVRGEEVGAVDLLAEEAGEALGERGNAAAGGLGFAGDADGVAVVFDEEQHGEAFETGGVQGLPEFAFAGGAFAGGDEGDFVGRGIAIARGLGAAHGLEVLRASGRGAGHDVVLGVAPVGGHLASAGRGVGGGADGLLQHFVRRDAEGEAEGAIAVVGVKPVVGGAEGHAGGDLDGLVAGAGDLEEDAVLALEDDLAVVEAARGVNEAEGLDELVGREGFEARGRRWVLGFGGQGWAVPR